jgi:transcriptional regulator with XRE-family HTH domain
MNRYNQNDDVRQAFAKRFRKALSELGYSASDQKEMRRLFGVSAQAVRKWAEAQSLPTATRLPQVASVLGVRRAWLQDGEEPMYPVLAKIKEDNSGYKKDSEIGISADELKLLHLYKRLSTKQRDSVQQLMVLLIEGE